MSKYWQISMHRKKLHCALRSGYFQQKEARVSSGKSLFIWKFELYFGFRTTFIHIITIKIGFKDTEIIYNYLKVLMVQNNSEVWCSIFRSQKYGVQILITNRWTRSSLFDVQKNDFQVSWMSNLVNPVKALLGSMFDVTWSQK